MLKLMYAYGDIDWEEEMVKNIHLATFTQGFKKPTRQVGNGPDDSTGQSICHSFHY
jgi:hypothetical protein